MNAKQNRADQSKAWRKYVKLGVFALILLAVCDTFLFPWFGFRILSVGEASRDSAPPSHAMSRPDGVADPKLARSEPTVKQPIDSQNVTDSATTNANSQEPAHASDEKVVVRENYERTRMSTTIGGSLLTELGDILGKTFNVLDNLDTGDIAGRRRELVELEPEKIRKLLERIDGARKRCVGMGDLLLTSDWILRRALSLEGKLTQALEEKREVPATVIAAFRKLKTTKIPKYGSVERGLKHLASIPERIVNGTLTAGDLEDIELIETFIDGIPDAVEPQDAVVSAFLDTVRGPTYWGYGGLRFYGPMVSLDDMVDALVSGFDKPVSYYEKERNRRKLAKDKKKAGENSDTSRNDGWGWARELDSIRDSADPARKQYSKHRVEFCIVLIFEDAGDGKQRIKHIRAWEAIWMDKMCRELAAHEGKKMLVWAERVFRPARTPAGRKAAADWAAKFPQNEMEKAMFGDYNADPDEPVYVAKEALPETNYATTEVRHVPRLVFEFIKKHNTNNDGTYVFFPKPSVKEILNSFDD